MDYVGDLQRNGLEHRRADRSQIGEAFFLQSGSSSVRSLDGNIVRVSVRDGN